MGLRIDLAGDVAIDHDGERVDRRAVRGTQPWLAFALLVLARGRPVSRDELADGLWPGELPDTWESALRNSLTKVRDLLTRVGLPAAELLVRSDAGWALALPADTVVDLDEAERCLAAAAEHLAADRHEDAVRAAEVAVGLLARPLLAGVEGTWLDELRGRLETERINAEELLATALLRVGDRSRAASVAEGILRASPYRESVYRLLMEVHASGGNRAEALRTYEQCRHLLAEELGVSPSDATEQAYVALLGPEPSPAPPPPRLADAPSAGSDLVGREAELAQLADLLARPGLVTLRGPGGVGKSTLARAARALAPVPEERRWWVDLAAIPDDVVPSAVASTVTGGEKLLAGAEPTTALRRVLRDDPALVVLDDCERSIGAVRELVTALLERCPDLTVLLTSRVPSGGPAEQVIEVQPLVTPEISASFDELVASTAVQLFARRAGQATAGFTLTPEVATQVADICRRLDGMPLALELAAARLRSLPLSDIAGYLEDRFRLLRRAPGDLDGGRHRTLEDAVRWSHDLLDEPSRRVFDALAVFAGPFNLEAAAAVAGEDALDVLEALEGLVDRSMVMLAGDEHETRYRLLETLRAYGDAQLAAASREDEVRKRHLDHYLRLAEDADAGVRGPDEATWVRRVDEAFPNLRAAWTRAHAAGDVDASLRLPAALFEYAYFRLQREVGAWAVEATRLPGAAAHPRFVRTLGSAIYLVWLGGDTEGALALAASDPRVADDTTAQQALGSLYQQAGDNERSAASFERGADLAEADGDRYSHALALGRLVLTRLLMGHADVDLADAALQVATETGNPSAISTALWAGGVARYDSDKVQALDLFERAIQVADPVQGRMQSGAAEVSARDLRAMLDGVPPREALLATVGRLDHWIDAGAGTVIWPVIRRVIGYLARCEEYEAAAVAIGAEAAAPGLPARERERIRFAAIVDRVREGLGTDAFERHTAEGAGLDEEAIVTYLKAVGAAEG